MSSAAARPHEAAEVCVVPMPKRSSPTVDTGVKTFSGFILSSKASWPKNRGKTERRHVTAMHKASAPFAPNRPNVCERQSTANGLKAVAVKEQGQTAGTQVIRINKVRPAPANGKRNP